MSHPVPKPCRTGWRSTAFNAEKLRQKVADCGLWSGFGWFSLAGAADVGAFARDGPADTSGLGHVRRTPPNECPTLPCSGGCRGAGLRWLPWLNGSKACQRSCPVGQGLNLRGQLLDRGSVVGFSLLLGREG
jgi:hypothetical protein